jgi:hypothetical protein
MIYSSYGQLQHAPEEYQGELRQRLAKALKLGRKLKCGLGYRELHWAYEAAYPCKVFWWIAGKVRNL